MALEFLVAGGQEIVHIKPFFFPFSSAATCTNRPIEVDQRHLSTDPGIPVDRSMQSVNKPSGKQVPVDR
ncbi:hypothetical protein Taro_027352 [Colocasia esculenta]|uniref:Uncharacterized protein n=1 Tax=Colocasia esculenta TaxID=4460 RepID=A0A843VM92_COLES|nr:hypothetical protein [Colocasia esculenta]